MFLTRAEIIRLTDKIYKSAQKRVLRKKGYRFEEDDAGHPLVLRASVERRIEGKAISAEPRPAPDFSAFPQLR